MFFDEYKSELVEAINSLTNENLKEYADAILECDKNGGTIYIVGNGGSAATASHFQCDLGKGSQVEGKKRIRTLSLTDNVSIMSAISNDISYDDVFLYQLQNLLTEKDLVVGISASGNSENVVKCFEYAKSIGAKTYGLIGFSGGKMLTLSDGYIHINSYNYGVVEDMHLVIGHLVSQYIKQVR